MRKMHWVIVLIILVFPVAGSLFYPYMPERMATHWGGSDDPNGYMSKFAGTYVVAIFMMLFIATGLGFDIGVTRKFAKITGGKLPKLFFDGSLILLSVFLLVTYIAVLVWNTGRVFSMTKFTMIGLSALIIGSTAPMLFLFTKKTKGQEKGVESGTEYISTTGEYKDSLIEVSGEKIVFKNYYFPVGNKTVNLCQVESVEEKPCTMKNGKWRLHGSNDFNCKTWFSADYARPGRDKIFVMKVKGKWMQIGFTVEHSGAVCSLFRGKGLLRP
jgi:hypothetical protein